MSGYPSLVRMSLARLLVLLSVLLMPLGMESPARSAPVIDHHSMSAEMPRGHCPDQRKSHDHDGLATCSLACSSTLPAQEMARPEFILSARELTPPMRASILRGILPEIATPPPKRA